VGMSTVPEVIVAVHGGMRVLGISIITDEAVPETLQATTLQQIVAAAGAAEPSLTALVTGVLAKLPA
jgi:purine-nucleoside phosphorylase